MILKHLTVKSKGGIGRLLSYMHNSPERLRDKRGQSFVIRHNIRGESLEEWIQEFLDNEERRVTTRKDSVFLNHVILSFHADDSQHITQEVLQDMAQKYIDLTSQDALVIAVPHFEKDHLHVHLGISGVDCFEGKSLRMSQRDFAESKQKLQEYQMERWPQLEHSIVEHGRKQKRNLVLETERSVRTKKEQLIDQVHKILQESISQETFLSRLEEEGLSAYYRGERLMGIEVDGKKYRFGRTLGIDLETFVWESKKEETQEKETNMAQDKQSQIVEIQIDGHEAIHSQRINELSASDHENLLNDERGKEESNKGLPESKPTINSVTKTDKTVQDKSQFHARNSELSSLRQQRLSRSGRDERNDNESFKR